MLFTEGAAARASTSHSCTALGVPSPCTVSPPSPCESPCRSWGTYFILKMAVSQEQKPYAERRQEGHTSVSVPLSLLLLSKAQGTRLVCCASSELGQEGIDDEHPATQSHRWAKVKEVTVPCSCALPTGSSTSQVTYKLLASIEAPTT